MFLCPVGRGIGPVESCGDLSVERVELVIPQHLRKGMPHSPIEPRLVSEQADLGIPLLAAEAEARETAAFGEAIDHGPLQNESTNGPVLDRA